MSIAIMTSGNSPAVRLLVERYGSVLEDIGLPIKIVVLDENRSKRDQPWRHRWNVAARQARVSKSSVLTAMGRALASRLVYGNGGVTGDVPICSNLPESVPLVRVPGLNSNEAVETIARNQCTITCLIGAGILTKDTLEKLGGLVLNIHASDPRFVRGGPPVFWEILAGLSHITLTVHQVVPRLDAGPIYLQRKLPILFCGGLGATVRETMRAARPVTADLFADVLRAVNRQSIIPLPVELGPVRSTPSLRELIVAERRCRSISSGSSLSFE